MTPNDIVSEQNITYYNSSYKPLSEDIKNLVIGRIRDATVTDTLNIDVRDVEDRIQISVWATDVDSHDKFYDEWHSEFYTVEDMSVEVDIR